MRTLNTTVFTGAMLCAAIVFTAASAARADDIMTRSVDVRLSGLDLNAPPDQAVLRHRLMIAATKVCADGGVVSLNDNAFLDCRKVAFDRAWSEATVLMAAAKGRSLMAAAQTPAWAQPKTIVASAAPPAALPAR